MGKMTSERFSLRDKICCPMCGALFGHARPVDESDGMLNCSHCSAEFPIRDGVLFATVPALQPEREIRAVVDRYIFWQNLINDTLEAEFKHALDLSSKASETIYKKAFSDIAGRINFHSNPTILICGAGAGEIAAPLVKNGSRVVALDYHPAELLFGLHGTGNTERTFPDAHIRSVVAYPWRMPFLNEQFDIVVYLQSTPCPVSFQQTLNELVRVLVRRGKLFLFWGYEGNLPQPHGNEAHYGMFSPRTYQSWRAPGEFAIKMALLYAGGRSISFRHYKDNLPVGTEGLSQSGSNDEQVIFQKNAFSAEVVKRKAHQVRGPQRPGRVVDRYKKYNSFPSIMARFQDTAFLYDIRQFYRHILSPRDLYSSVDYGKNLGFINELGWRHIENIGTEQARYPFSLAFCYLKGNDSARVLKLNIFGIPRRVSRRYVLDVEVNGTTIQLDKPISPGWQTRYLDLSNLKDTSVIEVFIHQQNLFRLIDSFAIFDYRSLGIGVKRISVE